MIIEKLRSRTKEAHEALESSMFPAIQQVKDVGTYAALLRIFYGYYQPLEAQMHKHIDTAVVTNYGELRSVSWIIDDLTFLGESTENIPLNEQSVIVDSHAAAMGALYVTEGSTLGGKIICKTIASNLGMMGVEGLRFFNGYGERTGSHWKMFLATLDRYSNTPNEDAIVESANNVFAGFSNWMQKQDANVLLS